MLTSSRRFTFTFGRQGRKLESELWKVDFSLLSLLFLVHLYSYAIGLQISKLKSLGFHP